ncbi:MAG: metallophosphoesterase, partial [Mesorhizobium sp.]
DHPAAQYNLFEIGGKKGGWTIRLTRRGLTGPALPPSDIQVIELGADMPVVREPVVRS